CHLHPQWQRRIVPALLRVMKSLTGRNVPVQLVVATHSPMVMMSAEAEFNDDKDVVFTLELVDQQAVVNRSPWAKQGDAVNWLVSEAFGLRQARSVQGEEAIEAAEALMRHDRDALPPGLDTQGKIHKALVR